MPPRKKKNLVIVESPHKAKTIHKFLGPNFEVVASKGHVRDLPEKKFGIDIDKGWVPTYRLLDRSKEVLADLKSRAAAVDKVYLATDPDREGEAIAWHLKEALGLKDDRVERVTFIEITKKAVQDAFNHTTSIDMDRVAAQEARRLLDRVVGYKLSPLLGKKVARGLSAGRVQSVAVRLIVDREREIKAFLARPDSEKEYWKITALLAPAGTVTKDTGRKKKDKTTSRDGVDGARRGSPEPADLLSEGLQGAPRAAHTLPGDGKAKGKGVRKPIEDTENGSEVEEPAIEVPEGAFLAELAEWAGQKFEAKNQQASQTIVDALQGAAYVVAKVEQKDRQDRPLPPFITSTLQQQASIRLSIPPKRTMQLAQRLYEGVELGDEGAVALITYMRTDSTRVANEALAACRDHILQRYGDKYLPAKPNTYESGKSAQEAHEAIRPTDLSYTPERVKPHLPRDEFRVYELIYNRFVASQMTPAVFAVTNVEVKAAQGLFKAQGKIMKFDGFRRVLAPAGKQEDTLLPPLQENQPLDLLELSPTQHFTQPPPRFNEASLVKALEKEGIGRPSTYAAIIETIKDRGYVKLLERRFHATDLGMLVTDMLVEHFPREMDLKFTSHMEEDLDQIERKALKRNEVLEEFYGPFSEALAKAQAEMEAKKGMETGETCPKCGKPLVNRWSSKTGTKFSGCSGYPDCDYTKDEGRQGPEPTDYTCPTCGKPMLRRVGQRGEFLGCSGYPECLTKMNFGPDGQPVLAVRPSKHKCEKCGAQMVIREGRRGPFLACSAFPKCRNAKDVDAEGNPVEPIDLGIPCDKCGGPMKVRRGRGGPFLGCTAFPKCRGTKQIPEELKEKVLAMLPAQPRKTTPAIEVTEPCPECGGNMVIRERRRGPGGYFLGCKKWPKCKGTREASPDVLEQVGAS